MKIIFLAALGTPQKGQEQKLQQSCAWRTSNRVNSIKGIAPTLMAQEAQYLILDDRNVSDIAKSTPMPSVSIRDTFHLTPIMATSPPSILKDYQTLISWSEAFLASLLVWPARGKDSMIPEVRSSLKSLGLLGKSNHHFFCLKTSKVFYLTTRGVHFLSSLPRFQNWGMTASGRLLTARLMFPKIESGSSLLDILEDVIDPKYFLSSRQKKFILDPVRLKKKFTQVHSQRGSLPAGTETSSEKTDTRFAA